MDGRRLSGESIHSSGDKASRKKELDKWLGSTSSYLQEGSASSYLKEGSASSYLKEHAAEIEEEEGELGELRRSKKKLDPHKLDLQKLSGDENVSVVHRESGKKVSIFFL